MAKLAGRSYSDPSYGSKKVFSFQRVSLGTRATDTVVLAAGVITAMSPIVVTDWNVVYDATGNGGASGWVLKKGTVALGTLAAVTNPTAGTTIEGTVGSDGTAIKGDDFYLYSGLTTSDPAVFCVCNIHYIERFLDTDN